MLDREWMVRSEHGSLLSQKQEPKLCLIHPSIDPRSWTLTLAAEGIWGGRGEGEGEGRGEGRGGGKGRGKGKGEGKGRGKGRGEGEGGGEGRGRGGEGEGEGGITFNWYRVC